MRIKVLSGGRKSIELPLSDAELNFQMKRIGIEETVPVCRLVEASEKDNPLCKFEGQSVNMDEVNFFAKRMDCLTEYERKVLYPQRGVCLYKCGNERYNLMVHAPEYKEKLFGNAGGR